MATSSLATHRPAALLVGYGLLLAAAAVAFAVIQHLGTTLTAPEPAVVAAAVGAAHAAPVNTVVHVLATLAAIITLGNLFAWGFRMIGQPAVIGEVMAGIALGPSLLGAIAPWAMEWLIPGPAVDPKGSVIASLQVIAQIGVVLYLFIVGLELNPQKIGRQAHAAIAISHASIVAPFVLGAALALWLYPILSTSDVSFTSFALFLAVAMSITAFPVLARILTDRGLEQTDLGTLALCCAATDDVTAWCLLAVVIGVSQSQVAQAIQVTSMAVGFVVLMFLVVKPLVHRFVAWIELRGWDKSGLPLMVIASLSAALATEAIGIHAAFGAFLIGSVIPHDSRLAQEVSGKLRDVVTVILLPAFFAVTGMKTQIGLISGVENWLICGVIIVVATVGKFGGTLAAARFTGIDWRTGSALGVLMNTRGLMELIALNIGLSLGLITPRLFAMMVLMALATTLATAPILKYLLREPDPQGAA